MTTVKQRSKSLLKPGFEVDPNQLSTNFNKKNQIGFKLKLLENLRNSKRIIEKYEEDQEEDKDELSTERERKDKNNKVDNYNKRNLSLGPINDESERQPKQIREKSASSKNIVLIRDGQKDKDEVKSTKLSVSTMVTNNILIKKEENTKSNLPFTKLIDEMDTLVDINTDLSSYVNSNISLDDETKIIDVWIEYEGLLIDNKPCKSSLIRLLYIFHKYFTFEKNIFSNDFCNKNYYRLIKIMISIVSASLFVMIYVGYDLNIKNQLRKLCQSVSKPLMQIYEIFSIKKLCKNLSEELFDKYTKFLNKSYKIQKSLIKNPNILVYISKEIDNAGLSLKQFTK